MAQGNADEHIRAVDEASRRTAQAATEATRQTAQAATEATRQTTEQGVQLSRQVFEAWATSAEATLRASFETQNALLATGRSIAGATSSTSQTALEQLANVIRQAQESVLQAFQASVRQGQDLGERFTPDETQGR